MYKRYIKRLFDIMLSFIALVLLGPFFIFVYILVRIKLGKPVIFKQKRPGKNEQIFTMYKFRTMTNEKDNHGELLPDSRRTTRFGNLLRQTSLDELPELINILKGDMSIVGPRPLVIKYLPYYTDYERQRHNIRPGLTGLSQVNGRNLLSWEKRLNMDVEYVHSLSFKLDLLIILLTIKNVLLRKDIVVGSDHVIENLDIETSSTGDGNS